MVAHLVIELGTARSGGSEIVGPQARRRLDLPLIYGEYAHHGGYHYYPDDAQTRAQLQDAGFAIQETLEGDDYRHYISALSNS
jgi:hypothetical protein